MSNYPPGVTGNEPQITGEYPCDNCEGWTFEDGICPVCKNTGILPEDVVDKGDTERAIENALKTFLGNKVNIDFEYTEEDGYMTVWLPYTLIEGTTWLREE